MKVILKTIITMLVLHIIPGELSSVVKQERTGEVFCTRNASYSHTTLADMHHEENINTTQGEAVYEQI